MVYEKVVQTIAEKLECDAAGIGMGTVLADLGMDSLDITEIVMCLESDFNIEIELGEGMNTVSDLVSVIEGLVG
ncbi:MAG: acyl carrier protein [Clostridia bacterium]|nr:acyl carrier protein [Clostridia bacterium]